MNAINWFPYLPTRGNKTPFDMSPIKPKDVRNIIKHKSNSSAPGPDGISYGILKKLPCLHHCFATLYNKILWDGIPPTTWAQSRVTLIYKKGDTNDPANFRMIALSTVFGKIHHQIMANRSATYMTENGYIDKSVQKAFIQRINGVIEHNQVLQEIIRHAHINKKTVHMTFYDLEDAFGSVSHQLIDTCLQRYKYSEPIRKYISNLYSQLSSVAATKTWTSEPFTFKHGVFQGDPWSPIIFLTTFNPLLERLQKEQNFGYDLNGKKYITLPFADDFNLITSHKASHQRINNCISTWTKSMGLKLKPIKCRSLSIVSGCSKPVEFMLDNQPISTLADSPHKFLGSHLTYSGKQSEILETIEKHFIEKLDRIDNLLIRDEYKLRIYKHYILPSSQFILTVHELTKTSQKTLDAKITKYLKKWAGLPRGASPAILYTKGLLELKPICQLYEECQTSAFISSRIDADKHVNHALDSRIQRENTWSKKQSTILMAESNMNHVVHSCNATNSSAKVIKTAAKNTYKTILQINGKTTSNPWSNKANT